MAGVRASRSMPRTGDLDLLRRGPKTRSADPLVEGMIRPSPFVPGTSGPSLQIVSKDAEYSTARVTVQKCLILSGSLWFTAAAIVTENT